MKGTERDQSLTMIKLAKYTLTHEADRGRILQTPISQQDIETITNSFRPDFELVPGITNLISESRNELLSLSGSSTFPWKPSCLLETPE